MGANEWQSLEIDGDDDGEDGGSGELGRETVMKAAVAKVLAATKRGFRQGSNVWCESTTTAFDDRGLQQW